jgi:AraC-like DNA-binding protein
MRYLAQIRLAHGADRLSRGDDVLRAAEAAGYSSEKSFARAFHRCYGVPPGQYRRNVKTQ